MEEFEKLGKDGVFDFGGGHAVKVNTKRPIGSVYNPNSGIKTKKEEEEESNKRRRYSKDLLGLNAFDRHKKFINDYMRFYARGKSIEEVVKPLPIKTDYDVLRENYRFIRSEEDDDGGSWEQRLAKKYYDKLFKEYCLADFTYYKTGKIGLRWRVQNEVVIGKGQFICGNKKCNEKKDLKSYEVNFAYSEAGEKKNALVKLRLCPPCAEMLNYKESQKRKEEEAQKAVVEQTINSEKTNVLTSTEKEKEEETSSSTTIEEKKKEQERVDNAWKAKPKEIEKTKEDEFDEYFEGMFL